MLELAISLTGLVMLTYVTLKVWTWLGTSIVQRQEAFQRTRVPAGQVTLAEQPSTAGMSVPYRPPQLQLVGAAGATPGVPGGAPKPPIVSGPCVPGNPLTREAQRIEKLAAAKLIEYNAQRKRLDDLNQQLDILDRQLKQLRDAETQLRGEIADLNTQIDDLTAQIDDPATDPSLIPDLIAQRDDLVTQRDGPGGPTERLNTNLAQQAAIEAQANALLPERDQLITQSNATMEEVRDLYDQVRDLLARGGAACP